MSKCSCSFAVMDIDGFTSLSCLKCRPEYTESMSIWASIISNFSENNAPNIFLSEDVLWRKNLGLYMYLCLLGSETTAHLYDRCFKTIPGIENLQFWALLGWSIP